MSAEVVYRLFDEDNALLYIGVSNNVWARIRTHEAANRFDGCSIARVTTVAFATRAEALAAEAVAIRAERPRFNIDHNWATEKSPFFGSEELQAGPKPSALRVSEVAEALQVSPSTVYDRIHRGEIPARAVGRALRVPRIWLDEFLAVPPLEEVAS